MSGTSPLTGGSQSYFPFLPGIPSGGSGSGVSAVTATLPIISSGGTVPNISLQIPLPVIDGGTGTTIPALIAGTGITITGPWPDQTISATGVGTVTNVTASAPITSSGGSTPNIALTTPLAVVFGGNGTATPALVAGTGVTITGAWPAQTINATGSGGTVTAVTGSGNILSSGGTTPNITTVASPTFTAITATGGIMAANLTSTASTAVGTGLTVGTTLGVTGAASAASLTLGAPLPILSGGTGTTTPTITAGTNVTITGTWPNLTINASSSGGGVEPFYDTGGTLRTAHKVFGQVTTTAGVNTFVTSAAITLSGSAAYTSATTYELINCTIDGSTGSSNLPENKTNSAVYNTTQSSGSSFTLTASLPGGSQWSATTLVLNYELEGY